MTKSFYVLWKNTFFTIRVSPTIIDLSRRSNFFASLCFVSYFSSHIFGCFCAYKLSIGDLLFYLWRSGLTFIFVRGSTCRCFFSSKVNCLCLVFNRLGWAVSGYFSQLFSVKTIVWLLGVYDHFSLLGSHDQGD